MAALTPQGNKPLSPAFLSYAFEFSSFPDFAGNYSNGANSFSLHLIANIGKIQGTTPYLRVGGNTCDYAVFNNSQEAGIIGIYNDTLSTNYPTKVTIGPSFYDSFSQWSGMKFIASLNQAYQDELGISNLQSMTSQACRVLTGSSLHSWEYGNEADQYSQGKDPARNTTYRNEDYVDEWNERTSTIKQGLEQQCPALADDATFRFIGPSFGQVDATPDPVGVVKAGLNIDLISEWSMHNYMGDASDQDLTLQGTLLNHSHIVQRLQPLVNLSRTLSQIASPRPFTLTEVNSLSGAGKTGISDVFGAALWTLDYNLDAASTGAIQRVHMQQGTNFRYSSWQPITTDKAEKATRPPYYGDIAVATSIGDSQNHQIQVAALNIGGKGETEVGYGIYQDGRLERIVMINMAEFHSSAKTARPSTLYPLEFNNSTIPSGIAKRLIAAGSDVTKNITFNGVSYDYELDGGRPVQVAGGDEKIQPENGVLNVEVPYSSAVILQLQWP